jgi:hypothetical protein
MAKPKSDDDPNVRKMLVADKGGRIDTRNIRGQPLGDTQALALAIQNFTDVLATFSDEVGSLVATRRSAAFSRGFKAHSG